METADTFAGSRPVAGDGVTVHERGELHPGTIVRVSTSGRCLWLRLDHVELDDATGATRFVPEERAWLRRAIRQPDGAYREAHDMWRVDVGVRRFRPDRGTGASGAETDAAALEEAVELLEPFLLKTRWYPMTGMLIPSVLESAEELSARIRAHRAKNEAEIARVKVLAEKLATLRKQFKRKC